MRALIRPTLFMIARLGLFLVVVAWIVGQRWEIRFNAMPNGRSMNAVVVDQGWVLSQTGANTLLLPRPFRRFPPHRLATQSTGVHVFSRGEAFTDFGEDDQLFNIQGHQVCPGIVYTPYFQASRLTIRHWFHVTIFALLNGVLMFVYRKRPEVQPCEN